MKIGEEKEPAQHFLSRYSKDKKPREVPNNESDYERIIKHLIKDWVIFGPDRQREYPPIEYKRRAKRK